MSDPLLPALGLATLAGLSMPLRARLAICRFPVLPAWLESEARHGVIAFGAGAFLAAVALMLIPEGTDRLAPAAALFWFSAGGFGFVWLDRLVAQSRGKAAQFLAMMIEYVPEALALGAVIAGDPSAAVLVALLIGLQNLPESFNAMRKMSVADRQPSIWPFAAMVPLGPVAAVVGLTLPETFASAIGVVMMVSAGGILCLMFQDIAPAVPIKYTALQPLGAVLGFGVGLAGDILI